MNADEFFGQLCDPDNNLTNISNDGILPLYLLLTTLVIVSIWLVRYTPERVGKMVGIMNYYILTLLFSLTFSLPFVMYKLNGFRIAVLNQTFHLFSQTGFVLAAVHASTQNAGGIYHNLIALVFTVGMMFLGSFLYAGLGQKF
jgi:hypothetical protein